jgi:hypothetical protein
LPNVSQNRPSLGMKLPDLTFLSAHHHHGDACLSVCCCYRFKQPPFGVFGSLLWLGLSSFFC